ncbi:MAG: hypothetical protein F9K18_02705 [Thermoanaerobaculia bacterium]|nr:MAG: hypothetical protein F9K18_02705 [Thermoanaerobaculia bacterium]
MTYLFWFLAAPTGVLAGLVLVLNLLGRQLSAATPLWLSALVSLAVLALLGWALRLARSKRPGLACLLVLGSWLVFALAMVANGLARQQVWN